MLINFNNTYMQLGKKFYTKISPTFFINPSLICFNNQLAEELGIDLQDANSQEIAAVFSGNKILDGSDLIALVYAGHQFGHFVPQLGDGRALLLGEIIDNRGQRRDLQLKGSGITPYSRNGDGRAALGPMIREYIVSEAMHDLRIETTRSLAVVATGEKVLRESSLPGAILTRVAASHLRIGTFEYFAARNDFVSIRELADYAIDRHYPHAKEVHNPYKELLNSVMRKQVSLIIDWMRVGFIHGVMNTDNMTISGETIDYGPCAFIDDYHPDKVFSSIDRHGRYSFSNQANICLWNILQFNRTLSFQLNHDRIEIIKHEHELTHYFQELYTTGWLSMMCRKIGITKIKKEDRTLINSLLDIMQQDAADYTLTFRYLSYIAGNNSWPFKEFFIPSFTLKQWIIKWQTRLESEDILASERSKIMLYVNPAFIPRNHVLEDIIESATKNSDFTKMHLLLNILNKPYEEQRDFMEFMRSPAPHERISQTFCGT